MTLKKTVTPMTYSGVTSCLFVFTFILFLQADVIYCTECSSLIRSPGPDTELIVDEPCTLDSDLSVTTLIVYDTISLDSITSVKIQANTVHVHEGGRISADGLVSGGSGTGESIGSGGRYLNIRGPYVLIIPK